ncbi:hypothetical protein [Pseudomonas sp. GZD-222]|uniref:hypothetical protein n=1 Tax=Pseudomonas sp. GZD-222 TaxID=3404805 RepID=UPI003BB48D81
MASKIKDWYMQNDLMPGSGGTFRVRGTYTVANPGITPILEKARIQDKSMGLNLELKLVQEEGIFTQVQTDKEVCFEMPGNHGDIQWVNVLLDGKLVITVTERITTS